MEREWNSESHSFISSTNKCLSGHNIPRNLLGTRDTDLVQSVTVIHCVPWENHLISLGHSFLICKTEIMPTLLLGMWSVSWWDSFQFSLVFSWSEMLRSKSNCLTIGPLGDFAPIQVHWRTYGAATKNVRQKKPSEKTFLQTQHRQSFPCVSLMLNCLNNFWQKKYLNRTFYKTENLTTKQFSHDIFFCQ